MDMTIELTRLYIENAVAFNSYILFLYKGVVYIWAASKMHVFVHPTAGLKYFVGADLIVHSLPDHLIPHALEAFQEYKLSHFMDAAVQTDVKSLSTLPEKVVDKAAIINELNSKFPSVQCVGGDSSVVPHTEPTTIPEAEPKPSDPFIERIELEEPTRVNPGFRCSKACCTVS